MSPVETTRPRLRLLHVILSRGFAGSERAAAEACNALARDNDVGLVVRRDHRNASGASVLDYVDPQVQVFELSPYWRTRAALADVIDQWRPSLIHTHLRRGTRYVVQLRRGVPHVATLHIDLDGRHYLRTDGLCCISPWQVEKVVGEGYAGTVFQIPNSLVPHPRITPGRRAELRAIAGAAPGDFLVGGVGRLAHGKGFDVLIEALRVARLPATRLVIVGEGSERSRLERLAAGLPVTFTGFRNDAKDWFQALDLFVSASRLEPFGRVIIEALDAGTPVIASDAVGPRDIAAHYPIDVTPAGDVAALAAAITRAHARPRTRLEVDLGEFHVERIAASLILAYRQLIEARSVNDRMGEAARAA
jgi:glycosyltransferase involved in cell wall biosynthesis